MNLCSFLPGDLKAFLQESCGAIYRWKQIFNWVYQKGALSFEEMTNLPKEMREEMSNQFIFPSLSLMKTEDSLDRETVKYLWKLQDNRAVESVLISSGKRRTVCLSSQVGCPAKCSFCASGKEGLFRNLSTGEIVEQALQINQFLKQKGEKITHIVFMGMGEPLENYDHVVKAIKLLIHPLSFNLSPRRITISTVGIIEGIEKLMDEHIPVNLALSLHAPNQHLRKKIVPYSRKYPLSDILRAVDTYSKKTKRDLTYEYVLIKGVNDSLKAARELGELLQNQQCTVNLIPFNPVPGIHLKRPETTSIKKFQDILSSLGVRSTCRYTKGKDIQAACGQLAIIPINPKSSTLQK